MAIAQNHKLDGPPDRRWTPIRHVKHQNHRLGDDMSPFMVCRPFALPWQHASPKVLIIVYIKVETHEKHI